MRQQIASIFLFFLAILLNWSCQQESSEKIIDLASPNEKIQFKFFAERANHPCNIPSLGMILSF
jgi:hypothetical protein